MPIDIPGCINKQEPYEPSKINQSEFILWCQKEKFFCKFHQAELHPADTKCFTHWSSCKTHSGKMCVPDNRMTEFDNKYDEAISRKQRLYINEKRSPIVRVFFEIDYKGKNRKFLSDQKINEFNHVLIQTFIRFYVDETKIDEKQTLIDRCVVCHTDVEYEHNMKMVPGAPRIKSVKAGIRMYFQNKYATSDHLRIMRRATLIELNRLFKEPIVNLGLVEDWGKIFDPASYTGNGLRLSGSRKIKACSCPREDEKGYDPTNLVRCALCKGTGSLDMGRVYVPWKVYDIFASRSPVLDANANANASEKDANASEKDAKSEKVPKTSDKVYIHLVENKEALQTMKNIGKFTEATRIRTITKEIEKHPSLKEWNQKRYEKLYLPGETIDNVMPEELNKSNGVRFNIHDNKTIYVHAEEAALFRKRIARNQIPPHDKRYAIAQRLIESLSSSYKGINVYLITTTEMVKDYKLEVNGPGKKWCQNMRKNDGYHNSTSVYFYMTPKGIVQRCYCRCDTIEGRVGTTRCREFKSRLVPLSEEVKQAFFPDPVKSTLKQLQMSSLLKYAEAKEDQDEFDIDHTNAQDGPEDAIEMDVDNEAPRSESESQSESESESDDADGLALDKMIARLMYEGAEAKQKWLVNTGRQLDSTGKKIMPVTSIVRDSDSDIDDESCAPKPKAKPKGKKGPTAKKARK